MFEWLLHTLHNAAGPVSDAILAEVAAQAAPNRWTVVPVVPESRRTVSGLAFGRRFAAAWGGCLVLALRPDGTFWPTVVAVESMPPSVPAGEARAACVRANRRRFPRPGHAFAASPACPALCVECAGDAAGHAPLPPWAPYAVRVAEEAAGMEAQR